MTTVRNIARNSLLPLGILPLALCVAPGLSHAQNADELAKQLSNPIASLTSVPMQLNYDDGIGLDDDGDKFTLNVQPVIPVSISEDWNMISRTIVPTISQHGIYPGAGTQTGFGDITQSLFFSPKALTSSGWTWGVGPVLLIPTATDDLLGTGKWGAGPTAVVLRQTSSGWTYGALVNQIWSFAGDSDRANVSALYFQPFLAKALGKGRTLSVNVESSYNWNGDQWTVPVNIGYSWVSRIGHQMVSYQIGARYYADKPEGGADWGLRFTFTLLFPRR